MIDSLFCLMIIVLDIRRCEGFGRGLFGMKRVQNMLFGGVHPPTVASPAERRVNSSLPKGYSFSSLAEGPAIRKFLQQSNLLHHQEAI